MDGRKHFIASLACCLAILTIPCTAGAKVIYVDDDAIAPGDGSSWQTAYKYLQDALTAAESAEKPVEIRVAQGVYKPGRSAAHPQGIEHTEYFRLTDAMSLLGGYTGLAGPDPHARDIQSCQTILSGDLAGNDAPVTDAATLMKDPARNDNSNIVGISADKGRVRLEGCTVTGGSYGALLAWGPSDDNEEASVTIMDCTFSGNRGSWADAPAAGAVNMVGRGLRIVRCLFEGNAAWMGGAVKASQHVVLDSCQFIGNYASSEGGAAYLGSSTVTNCIFTGNRAGGGGALYLDGSDTVTGCVFRGNRGGYGGALQCQGHAGVRDSVFVANEGAGGAGAQLGSGVRLSNCLLIGNRNTMARQSGAWAVREGSSLEMENCTVFGNRSAGSSFLVVDVYSNKKSSRVVVRNCVISDDGNEIWSNDSPVEISYSCIPGGVETIGDPRGWLIWGPGNITADACFADPGYWEPNGTPEDPNDDFFVDGDYHLKSQVGRWDPATEDWVVDDVTSPCIDAGDPNSPVGEEPFPNGGRVNMGAYGGTAEASMSYLDEPVGGAIGTGGFNGAGRVDFADLQIFASHWLEEGSPEGIIGPDIRK
jgi:hypothetical protein